MSDYYNLKNIHELLVQGFSADDLRYKLCQYENEFRPLFAQLSIEAGKEKLVYQIIEYSYQQLKIEKLLDWTKEHNPKRYEQHQPYLQERSTYSAPNLTAPLDKNQLGYGISLGGAHRGVLLEVAAADWTSYGQNAFVRVGWLYIPQYSASHAIAFFKLHVSMEGAGYIHITDVAHPAHLIWLQTESGFRREKTFHYRDSPSDVWEFAWKNTNYRLFPLG